MWLHRAGLELREIGVNGGFSVHMAWFLFSGELEGRQGEGGLETDFGLGCRVVFCLWLV